jgi:hypothetical protein
MRPALIGLLLLVGLRPGVEYAVVCQGDVQIAASTACSISGDYGHPDAPGDSTGLWRGDACAGSCFCSVSTMTSAVPESPTPVDPVRLLWTWRHVWGLWTWT